VILVDSDVLIEHLCGNAAARDWLVQVRESSGPLAISAVSLTEIAGGMRSPERREVIRLLGSMQRFEVSEQVAWRAANAHAGVPPVLFRNRSRRLPDRCDRAHGGT
jgi:predicted nucleic acid-binding protein